MRFGGVIDQGQRLCMTSPENDCPACGADVPAMSSVRRLRHKRTNTLNKK
jgi:hypothetical protein